MSHFAKLDENNLVTFVTVGRQEDDGLEEELNARTGDVYRQTSYNTRGVSTTPMESQAKTSPKRSGSTMRASGIRTMLTVTLLSPPTYPSWVLDEATCQWVAPIAYPAEGDHVWDEQAGDWVEVQDEAE